MTIDTDLATLREQLRHLGPWRGAVGDEALDRVETELARLRQERNEYAERLAWHREERDVYMKGNVWVRRAAEELERAETAERELARLREGLREIAGMGAYARRLTEQQAMAMRDKARALLADTPEEQP